MNKVYDESYQVAWEALREEIEDMIKYGYDPRLNTETLMDVLELMRFLHA